LTQWIAEGLNHAPDESIELHTRVLSEGLATGFSRQPLQETHTGPTLGDFVTVMRGIATGDNAFFFLTCAQAERLKIPEMFLLPAIGRTRDVDTDTITSETLLQLDRGGRPTRLFAPDGRPLGEFPPSVRDYLRDGEMRGLPEKALISQRNPWYRMERRQVPPFLFAYLGRRNARFIRNLAGVLPLTGFLCVYPRQQDSHNVARLWRLLQDPVTIANLVLVGKSYGDGAIKVEPRALERLPLPWPLLHESGLECPRLLL
jgi:hypothetical protein